MKFVFDLDDTLVSRDIIEYISTRLFAEGKIDRVYSNLDITNYDLRDLPANLKERVQLGFANPEYVWLKQPIVGSYYFLHYLSKAGHKIGIVTARPASTTKETIRFIKARFPNIDFELGIHVINRENQIDMKNTPTKSDCLGKLEPDFYFDDNADYCKQSQSLEIETYLISNKKTPWNHELADEINKADGAHPIKILRNVAFFPETKIS